MGESVFGRKKKTMFVSEMSQVKKWKEKPFNSSIILKQFYE